MYSLTNNVFKKNKFTRGITSLIIHLTNLVWSIYSVPGTKLELGLQMHKEKSRDFGDSEPEGWRRWADMVVMQIVHGKSIHQFQNGEILQVPPSFINTSQ